MKKIFLNQKLINFFEKIREEIFNNGFSSSQDISLIHLLQHLDFFLLF